METHSITTSGMKADPKSIQQFDDLITEPEVMAKLGYSKDGLYKLRKAGKIKEWKTIRGRKIIYSKTEIMKILNSGS